MVLAAGCAHRAAAVFLGSGGHPAFAPGSEGEARQTAAAVITVPLLLAGIEAAVDFYLDGQVDLFWSLLVSLPCLLLALLLLVLDRRRRFKAPNAQTAALVSFTGVAHRRNIL